MTQVCHTRTLKQTLDVRGVTDAQGHHVDAGRPGAGQRICHLRMRRQLPERVEKLPHLFVSQAFGVQEIRALPATSGKVR